MDLFSHILWTRVFTRNKLWDQEALLFAVLPDAGFLLIMLYVIFGKPMNLDFSDAMQTIPPGFIVVYRVLHSFVTVGIVALILWKLKPSILPALSAWVLHICMDIPVHDGMFGTRFLYPILPDFYITGVTWGQWQILAGSYLLLLVTWYYLETRELKKHRRPELGNDWLDRVELLLVGLVNPRPLPSYASQGQAPATVRRNPMSPPNKASDPVQANPPPGTSECPKDFG
jgi:hypothetical protein